MGWFEQKMQELTDAQHRSEALHRAADETDDARDHDELHAAGDVVMNGIHSRYIDRWVEELEKRFIRD